MPILMRQIVFTKKEVEKMSGASATTVSKIINQLVDLGVIETDTTVLKKGYRYQSIYNLFVAEDDGC